MFPDSSIASSMKLKKDKISYGITYGLAPHFKKPLINSVKTCESFIVGFDETLKKVCSETANGPSGSILGP